MSAGTLRTRALQVGLFVLLGLSILIALDTISRAHPPRAWDGILLARMDTVREDTGEIRSLVLGSSHAGGVDPDLFDTGAIVFAFPWGDLAETAHQARVLAAALPELREVLIPISFFTFHWSNDASDEDFLLDSRRTFHAVLGHGIPEGWRPVEGDLASLARGKGYWVARRDHWYRVARGLLRGDESDDEPGTHLEVVRSDSFLVAHAEERVSETLERKREMIERNPELPRENAERLSTLIQHLDAAGVRVVLFTPPFHRRYRTLYHEEASTREKERILHRLVSEQAVEWHDFSDHPMGEDGRWFLDSDHLNQDGMRRFTRMLLDEMRRDRAFRTAPRSPRRPPPAIGRPSGP